MSYDYQKEKSGLFTEEMQKTFLEVRDRIHKLMDLAGVVTMEKAMQGSTGCTWKTMACVDRLVELNEIREVKYGPCPGQYRIFIKY